MKNGSDLFVFMDGVATAHSTGHTLRMPSNHRGTSNKDTKKFATHDSGRIDPEVSTNGLAVYDEIERLMNAYLQQEPVTLHLAEKDGESPDESKLYATGNFIITDFEKNADDDENVTYSVTFKHHSDFTTSFDPKLLLKANTEPGAAAVFVAGGKPPYSYEWNGSPGGIFWEGSGEVTCVVTDDSTPAITGSITIDVPSS